jgi:hypothetical protein
LAVSTTRDVRPHHGEHDDVRGGSILGCSGRDTVAERFHHRGKRRGPSTVGDHDRSACTARDLGHCRADPTRADDPDGLDVGWLHHGPF